jgi:hypothetical protein
LRNLIHLLVYLLSRSPLFSITLDENFDEISDKNYMNDQLRLSVLSFGLGVRKLYFFTLKKGEGFRVFKIIRLKEIQDVPSEEVIESKVTDYTIHIKSKQHNEIEIEKEFLQYRINQEDNSKNIALSKINNYIAIVSILVPLFASNVIQAYSQIKFKYKVILLIVVGYTLLNAIIYILEFLKVKGFTRSSFADIKKSSEPNNKIAESYYADWYSMKQESVIYVTFVTCVERYLKYVIAVTLCILVLGNFNNIYKQNDDGMISNSNMGNKIYNISFKCGQVNKEDLKKLTDIYMNTLSDNVKEIVIIKNLLNDYNANEQYEIIYKSLKMYNGDKINITVISEDDNNIKESEIKIILIGGKK